MSYEDLIEWVRIQGGLTVLAHPAIRRSHYDKWIRSPPDAVEVLNASYPFRFFINRGIEIVDGLHVTPVGGSDAHSSSAIGNAYTMINTNRMSVINVLNSIKRGSAWYEGNLSPINSRIRTGIRSTVGAMYQYIFF